MLNGLKNADKEFYLAVKNDRQFLIFVSDEYIESHALSKTVPTEINASFSFGDLTFRNCGKILYA